MQKFPHLYGKKEDSAKNPTVQMPFNWGKLTFKVFFLMVIVAFFLNLNSTFNVAFDMIFFISKELFEVYSHRPISREHENFRFSVRC